MTCLSCGCHMFSSDCDNERRCLNPTCQQYCIPIYRTFDLIDRNRDTSNDNDWSEELENYE